MKLLPPAMNCINLKSLSSYLRREDRERSSDLERFCHKTVFCESIQILWKSFADIQSCSHSLTPAPHEEGCRHSWISLGDWSPVCGVSLCDLYFIACAYSSVRRCPRCTGTRVWKGERQLSEVLIKCCSPIFQNHFLRRSLSLTWNLPSRIG